MRRVPTGESGVPIYLEISRLHRCVTIVARGDLSPEEIAGACRQLADEGVSHFAKLVDTSSSTSGVGQTEMEQIVQSLRGRSPEAARGPVAFLVDRNEPSFAGLYAETQDKRRVQLFTSLHLARDWLLKTQRAGWQNAPQPGCSDEAAARAASEPWSDPAREATMYRRGQRRVVPVSRSRPSYAMV
jgi:hypothetical protein